MRRNSDDRAISLIPSIFQVLVLIFHLTSVNSLSNLRPSTVRHQELVITSSRHLQPEDDEMFCPIGRKESPTQYIIDPAEDLFTEVSYMAYSEQSLSNGNPIVWVGSDGKQTSISAVDLVTRQIICTYDLDVKRKGDWEAMSLGPCTSNNTKSCLYLGNVGSNGAHRCRDRECTGGREEVLVYKLEEPVLTAAVCNTKLKVSTLILNYKHEKLPTTRADCETMFVDFTGDNSEKGKPGDIYLVTKFPYDGHLSRVTKVPVAVHENLNEEDTIEYSLLPVGDPMADRTWTGGDMSLDGTLIAIRDYYYVYYYARPPWVSVGEALTKAPCRFKSKTKNGGDARQFETVAMVGRGRGGPMSTAEASECTGKNKQCPVVVFVYELEFDESASNKKVLLFPDSSATNPPTSLPSAEPSSSVAPTSMPSYGPSAAPSAIIEQSIPIELCPDSHRCENGAKCVENPNKKGSYYCDCQEVGLFHAFEGLYCEHKATQYCKLDLINWNFISKTTFCTNNGRCRKIVNSDERHFGCDCPRNYEGSHCQFIRGTQPVNWPSTKYTAISEANGNGSSTVAMDIVPPTSMPSYGSPAIPSATPTLSSHPSAVPMFTPSMEPSSSVAPTSMPSYAPSATPSATPTLSSHQSAVPTSTPSVAPSLHPTSIPSMFPSTAPTSRPSSGPSLSLEPSAASLSNTFAGLSSAQSGASDLYIRFPRTSSALTLFCFVGMVFVSR